MTVHGACNKQGSVDRINGIRLSDGKTNYGKDTLRLNEYTKGWMDMDTFLRMAQIVGEQRNANK